MDQGGFGAIFAHDLDWFGARLWVENLGLGLYHPDPFPNELDAAGGLWTNFGNSAILPPCMDVNYGIVLW